MLIAVKIKIELRTKFGGPIQKGGQWALGSGGIYRFWISCTRTKARCLSGLLETGVFCVQPPGTLFKCDFFGQIMRYRMSQKSKICGKNAEKNWEKCGKNAAKM